MPVPTVRVMLTTQDMLELRELATEMNVDVDTAARIAVRLVLRRRREERAKGGSDDEGRDSTVQRSVRVRANGHRQGRDADRSG